MKFGVGQSVPRKEDPWQITGGGRFTDDISLPDQAYLGFNRSPYAHGTIVAIDTDPARRAAVVHAALNALSAFGVQSIDMPLTSEKLWRLMNPI